MKFLASVDFSEDSFRLRISSVFADMHLSVITASARMLLELKRYNYVTPTNYLELVKGYRNLLNEKSNELRASASKLANGLAKLTDASEQVAELSKELEVKKVIVAQSQKDCEDLLVTIVSERRVADEQKKQVEADSERIGTEAKECKAISDDAEADLGTPPPPPLHSTTTIPPPPFHLPSHHMHMHRYICVDMHIHASCPSPND